MKEESTLGFKPTPLNCFPIFEYFSDCLLRRFMTKNLWIRFLSALVKRVFVSRANVEASDRFKNIRFSRGSCYVSEEVKHGEFGFRLKPRRSAAVAGVFSQNVRFCQLPVTRLLGLVAQSGTFASWVCTVFWTQCRETLRKPWLQVENVIASTVLIFMLFEAIFILVFVCSWWKRWEDLRTSWIPLWE